MVLVLLPRRPGEGNKKENGLVVFEVECYKVLAEGKHCDRLYNEF